MKTEEKLPTKINFRLGGEQRVNLPMGGVSVIKFEGICPLTQTRLYSCDTGNDPRGPLGVHAIHEYVASEYNMEGPTLAVSWLAVNNDRSLYERGLALAQAKWTGKGVPCLADDDFGNVTFSEPKALPGHIAQFIGRTFSSAISTSDEIICEVYGSTAEECGTRARAIAKAINLLPDYTDAAKAMRDGWEGNLTEPMNQLMNVLDRDEDKH